MLTPNHALKANVDESVENAMCELHASRQDEDCEGEGAPACDAASAKRLRSR
jgi:hypothetical protein